jgi:hypothetical protein
MVLSFPHVSYVLLGRKLGKNMDNLVLVKTQEGKKNYTWWDRCSAWKEGLHRNDSDKDPKLDRENLVHLHKVSLYYSESE